MWPCGQISSVDELLLDLEMRRIDIITTAIPRPLLKLAIESFMRKFIGRERYHVRWLFHLDQYRDLDQAETMACAAELSRLFDESILIRSRRNIGFLASARKLLRLSEASVVFVEDDWFWRGRFILHRIESELKRQRCHAFSFRNHREYVGAMGCCYWTRTVVDAMLTWRRPDVITTEKDVKRLMRHCGLRTLTLPEKKLHDYRPVRHLGPGWSLEQGLGHSTRID